jgi:hypothetical protein
MLESVISNLIVGLVRSNNEAWGNDWSNLKTLVIAQPPESLHERWFPAYFCVASVVVDELWSLLGLTEHVWNRKEKKKRMINQKSFKNTI